ncbi:hypothetical protein GCK72_008378 [Caenorhabditis remanei]|uniref:UPAR/Ly6 domain-containing protein n=1 Tax=Caenorhabditis remanei TaxID=31234 RepID=A0A6A5H0X8_CAERE|nr:hypothetical protein GCK72_008378 [Caenorhabditis remanei]KAF1760132.1 hypothetical protein GCK72_008378 [Caenorhabditis remanei]
MIQLLLLIFILISVAAPTVPIQCWNCVGDDCDSYRASSNNWELVTCPVGSVCQKTNFMFYSNQKNKSIDISTVRSCSYETGCTWDRSKSCQKNPVEYSGRGCIDRYCCGKDQCNGSNALSVFLVIWMIFLMNSMF